MSLKAVENGKSAREIAEAELNDELQKENVKKFKELLEKRHKAEVLLRNINNEIADLEAELSGD